MRATQIIAPTSVLTAVAPAALRINMQDIVVQQKFYLHAVRAEATTTAPAPANPWDRVTDCYVDMWIQNGSRGEFQVMTPPGQWSGGSSFMQDRWEGRFTSATPISVVNRIVEQGAILEFRANVLPGAAAVVADVVRLVVTLYWDFMQVEGVEDVRSQYTGGYNPKPYLPWG